MAFLHSCFISYKRPPLLARDSTVKHFWIEFVEAIEQRLGSFLTTLPPFRDNQLNTMPGAAYPAVLSKNLCTSVCLVAVLVPEYFESNWCLAEWSRMEELEKKRLGAKGLIMPVFLRGDRQLAEQRAAGRTLTDLSQVVNPKKQLDSVRYRQRIEFLASSIDRFVDQISDPCVDCDHWDLGVGAEVATPGRNDPSPF